MEKVKTESELSLPDQLAIESSSASSFDELLVVPTIAKCRKLLRKRHSKRLEAILKPKVPLIKKYFTNRTKKQADERKQLNVEDDAPFDYPSDMEEFAQKLMSRAWRDDVKVKELQKKCYEKSNYKTRHQEDLLSRLYVEPPNPTSMLTIHELDPHYFKIVEGRPIPENLNIRDYIDTVRESLRTKIVCGYREDDVMLLDENLLLEQKMINIIRSNFQTYVNTFEEFLYRDHTSSMNLLKDAEAASNLAYSKYEEYKHLAKQIAAVRSKLYNSEEKWRHCKMYQRFLYSLSPTLWRKAHPISVTRISDDQEEIESEETIFGPYRMSTSLQEGSFRDILETFRRECSDNKEPELYFTKPEELIEVFRYLETQNLNSLLHAEELAGPLDTVKTGIRYAEETLDGEIKRLRQNIEYLEGGISWKEERAKYLEQSASELINNQFRQLIMEDKVLNLHVFVEDTYETRICPNDANLSMLQMMTAINQRYREELLMLDKVPREQVVMLEGSCYMEQMTVMRLAEKASRQFAELQRVTKNLTKAFAPPYQRPKGKDAKNRSPPMASHKPPIVAHRSLTQDEEDYLEHFTEFCQFTDDANKYFLEKSQKISTLDDNKFGSGVQSLQLLKITTNGQSSGGKTRKSEII